MASMVLVLGAEISTIGILRSVCGVIGTDRAVQVCPRLTAQGPVYRAYAGCQSVGNCAGQLPHSCTQRASDALQDQTRRRDELGAKQMEALSKLSLATKQVAAKMSSDSDAGEAMPVIVDFLDKVCADCADCCHSGLCRLCTVQTAAIVHCADCALCRLLP